ncbi:MAG: hypothetical protein H6721_10715 [Sandaracinus sp.]|nr:hypothetical protein [Sandaracinus sp.]MCB9624575.1 hypothetical protein [Sandaracinus sp.]MCB9632591.1 hypothetical protein [Sandaracinus sp.]
MRGRRIFLVLVLLGGVAAAAFWLLSGPRLREPLVENVPEEAAAYARVDVKALLRSSWWRRFVTERGGDRGLQRMRERCGIEPSDQLAELAAYVGAEGQSLDHVTFLARGPFDHEALGDCMRQIVEEDGGGLRRVEIDGVPGVAGARGDSRIAFLGRDGAAFGNERSVRQVIAITREERPHVGGTLRELHDAVWAGETPPEVVAVAVLPDGWRRAIRERVQAPGVFGEALDALRAIAASARVSRGLALSVRVRFEDASVVEPLVEQARLQRDALLDDPLLGLTAAGPALRRVAVEGQGSEVVLAVDLDESLAERLVELAQRMLQRPERRRRPRTQLPSPDVPLDEVPIVEPTAP